MKVPYINLGLQHQKDKKAILDKVSSLLDSGMFILGEEVKQFEDTFAALCQTKYAVGVANGTDALVLSMRALGIGPGDEVITAPNSYLASASSIELCGAKAVFADVLPTYNLDPAEVEKKITSKTKAIIAVHLTGRPADMEAINEIACKHDLYVIEDAAQAVGAKIKDKPVGAWGFIGSFSLHPLKNLAAIGDAGIITTNDDKVYEFLLKARTHGMKSRDECEFWSINSRLDAVQAAVLNIKIKNLPAWNNRRRAIAKKYQEQLGHLVHVPKDSEGEYSVYHTFIIRSQKRNELQAFLKEKGIDTKVHYPIAIHQQEAAKENTSATESYPETERQIEEILSLPVYPELTDEQVNYICQMIKQFYSK